MEKKNKFISINIIQAFKTITFLVSITKSGKNFFIKEKNKPLNNTISKKQGRTLKNFTLRYLLLLSYSDNNNYVLYIIVHEGLIIYIS